MRQEIGKLKPGTSFRTILTGREGTVLGTVSQRVDAHVGVLVVLDPKPGTVELEERALHPGVVVEAS